MSVISIYQAFVPTSSHNVGLIVDRGAEVLLEVVALVDVRIPSPTSLLSSALCPATLHLYYPLPSARCPLSSAFCFRSAALVARKTNTKRK
jgi:hypothetical protein